MSMRISHEKTLALQVVIATIQHLHLGVLWHTEIHIDGCPEARWAACRGVTDVGVQYHFAVDNLHGDMPCMKGRRTVGVIDRDQKITYYLWRYIKGEGVVVETPPVSVEP